MADEKKSQWFFSLCKFKMSQCSSSWFLFNGEGNNILEDLQLIGRIVQLNNMLMWNFVANFDFEFVWSDLNYENSANQME